MKKYLLLFSTFLTNPAIAQWQVPIDTVPIGRGPGVVGFNSGPTVYYPICDTTGIIDCSAIIQTKITAAEISGGVVQLQCTGTGSILINAGVTISKAIHFQGCGYEEFKGYQGQFTPQRGSVGTYINTTSTSFSPITVGPGANGAVISDLAFTQAQPAESGGWTPISYPPTIKHAGAPVSGTSVGRLEVTRVLFGGVSIAIQNGTTGGVGQSQFTGRDFYHNIEATCLNVCILNYAVSDIARIEDLHVWPFFFANNSATGSTPNIEAYIEANVTGIINARNDNPFWNNIFFYGVNRGILLSGLNPDGPSNAMQISNLDCDNVKECIAVANTTGSQQYAVSVTNMTHAGQTNGVSIGSYAVHTLSDASNIKINVTNLNAFAYFGSAVLIEGSANDFSLTNANVFHYNQQGGGVNTLVTATAGNAGWLYGRIQTADTNSSPGIASTNVIDLTATARTGTGNTTVYSVSPIIGTPLISTTTVGALPACGAGTKSTRSFVTDNNTALSFSGVITAGGTIQTPVYCDGTVWRQG